MSTDIRDYEDYLRDLFDERERESVEEFLSRRVGEERERAEIAEEERDLAIAHDSQPYPTAEAYEKVCTARTKWQEQAEAAEKALKPYREFVEMVAQLGCKGMQRQPYPCHELPGYSHSLWCVGCLAQEILDV